MSPRSCTNPTAPRERSGRQKHIIAARAGFHPHSPTTYLDKCMGQIEMTLNSIHPYEYDPRISA
jgi:hypothetical protein